MKLMIKPPYKPLVQLPWCCAAASIQWILHRHDYWVDQEQIAKEIRTRVPKRDINKFTTKMLTAKRPFDYGTRDIIGKDAYLVNDFFKRHKIPMHMVPHKIGTIRDVRDFLVTNLKAGNDIMLAFHSKGLGYKTGHGHVVVLAGLKEGKRPVAIIGDPSPTDPKFWEVRLDRLTKAMDRKWDGCERGFYVFGRRRE
jgi:hypothetical protein